MRAGRRQGSQPPPRQQGHNHPYCRASRIASIRLRVPVHLTARRRSWPKQFGKTDHHAAAPGVSRLVAARPGGLPSAFRMRWASGGAAGSS